MTFRGFYYREQDWMLGTTWRIPVDGRVCWKCERPNPDLAHHVYEYIAALAGLELLRRVEAALDEHRDACRVCPGWGAGSCEIARDLYELLPGYLMPVAIA